MVGTGKQCLRGRQQPTNDDGVPVKRAVFQCVPAASLSVSAFLSIPCSGVPVCSRYIYGGSRKEGSGGDGWDADRRSAKRSYTLEHRHTAMIPLVLLVFAPLEHTGTPTALEHGGWPPGSPGTEGRRPADANCVAAPPYSAEAGSRSSTWPPIVGSANSFRPPPRQRGAAVGERGAVMAGRREDAQCEPRTGRRVGCAAVISNEGGINERS